MLFLQSNDTEMSNKKNYRRYKSMLDRVYTLQFKNSAKSFLPQGQIN